MIRNGGGRKVVDPKYWNEWWTTTASGGTTSDPKYWNGRTCKRRGRARSKEVREGGLRASWIN